jgi:antitoxin ParD1/3/4
MDLTSMNISIPKSLRRFVEAKVRAGGYGSASEYMRDLIRQARDRARKEGELRQILAVGIDQLNRGEAIDIDETTLPSFFADVKTRARKRLSNWKRRSRHTPKRS